MNRQKERRGRIFILVTAALCMASVAQADPTVRVRGIKVTETNGDTSIAIQSSAKPTFTTWKMEHPARVVIEMSGARLGEVEVPLDVGTRAVGTVTANVTDDPSVGPRTRIVLTLRQPSDYRVETKGNDIFLRVVPHAKQAVESSVAKSRDTSESVLKSQVVAQEKAMAKVKVESLEKDRASKAQLDREAQEKVEAQAQARKATSEKAEAERKAIEAAKARSEAEAQAQAAARAKGEAERQAQAAAKARKDAEVQAVAAAKAKLEAESKATEAMDARNVAVAFAKNEAKAREKAERQAAENAQLAILARAEVQVESEARQRAQRRVEETSKAESQAKVETEHLRKALAEAKLETAKARALAAKAREQEAKARELEAKASEQSSRDQSSRRNMEESLRLAKLEVESAHQRAARAENESQAIRQREAAQAEALRVSIQEVEARKKSLAMLAKAQEDQQTSLSQSARLVAAREQDLSAQMASLGSRDEAAKLARAKRDALAENASETLKKKAAKLVAESEAQAEAARTSVERARKERDGAVLARKEEEAKRLEQSELREQEERRLAEAVLQRQSEEKKLSASRAEQAKLLAEREKLLAEKTLLEKAKERLANEADRLAKQQKLAEQARAVSSSPPTVPVRPIAVDQPVPAAKSLAQTAPAPILEAPVGKSAVKEKPSLLASAQTTPWRSRAVTIRGRSLIRSVEFVDEPQHSSVIIDVDEAAEFKLERVNGHQFSLRIDHADLPSELERHLDATEYLGPVRIVSSYRDPNNRGAVRIVVELAEEVPNRIRQDGRRIFWDFQKLTAKTAPTLPTYFAPKPPARFIPAQKFAGVLVDVTDALWVAQSAPASARPSLVGKKRYVGRRIDLDFKGADIHNILRLLADVGGVNIVVADEVRGDVTIKMRDVPWDQALDVVLRAKGLGSVREGNLLRVAPLGILEKELEAEIARQKQIADVLPTETRLIGVSYADAASMVDKARDLLSPRGKISVDSRTNNLIISDVAKNLQLIEDLVRNLDTQTSQVVIEARVVEANSNFTRQMGIQWGGSGFADSTHGNPTGLVFPYNIGIGGGADDSSAPLGGLVPAARTGSGTTGSPNFLVNMPAAAGLGTGSAIGLTMGSVAGAFNLNLRLSAMESQGQVRILSSPRITTMDNVEATISQGVSIPVSVVSAAGAQTQFVDAKLLLGVKPHVTNEGTISLDVHITRNEPDFVNTGARGDPSIQKKEAKTSMLVRDGDTAVIGGIYTRNTGLSNAKVPFFSDIPVLGWFFRNRKENDNRSEFLVFITPRIVNRARSLGQ